MNNFNPSDPRIHKKGWGYELWIDNRQEYCGKLLFFYKDKKLSWHYHKLKTETFYLQSGKIIVQYGFSDNLEEASEIILNPGDSFHVSQGMRHRMIALEDSELFEFSTTHHEYDSYRLIKGD